MIMVHIFALIQIQSTSKLTMDTLRPLPLFLGVTGPSFCIAADSFSPPISSFQANKSTYEKFRSRMLRNLAYFATNYAFLVFGTVIVVALMHPGMLLYVGITWALWWLHIIVIREDVRMVVMDRDLNELLTPKRRSDILMLFTLWVAIGKCLKPLLIGMAISGVMILFHAVMRDPKKLASNITSSSASLTVRGAADSDSDEGSEVMVERADAV